MRLCQEYEIKYITYQEQVYPTLLKEIKLSPIILFYQGQLPTDQELERSLAVIGAREVEELGAKLAYQVGKKLSEEGWWNISGLAAGCDRAGHQGSLAGGGLTGAVLAHGLASEIYPPENEKLAAEILEAGGFLLSELPPSTEPLAHFFKWRDRLQSGLARGVFVVETARRGGTLYTVNYALRQGKKVYVWDPQEQQLPEEMIEGNLILLGSKDAPDNFQVSSKQKLEQVIGVGSAAELLEELARLGGKQMRLNL
nr:DNA-processing protein DprA [Natroniella sulfidigena]